MAELVGLYLQGDPEVWEPNAATMLMRRAVGEGWDGYDELEGKDFTHYVSFMTSLKFLSEISVSVPFSGHSTRTIT